MNSINLPVQQIQYRIFTIRGVQVMIDRDLAEMYGVETKVLNQAVKRNIERFPEDFMFQLNKEELNNWRSQIVTSSLVSQYAIAKQHGAIKGNQGPEKEQI